MPLLLQLLLAGLIITPSLVASAHAIIYKREPRAATLWAMAACLLPMIGPTLYYLLGINRVRREAEALRRGMVRHRTTADDHPCDREGIELQNEAAHLQALAQLGCRVTDRQLVPGNHIEALIDGAQAYPAMIEAFDQATISIAFSTYIFDSASIGQTFIDALARAHKRGVAVRVLIDAVGARYCRPRVYPILRSIGVPTALFNPPLIYPWITAFNLRNHRKILVVDGKTGFTGGFNIKREYWRDDGGECFRDLHFRIRGPVIAHLMEVFADDWQFATGEALRGPHWFPKLSLCEGGGLARGIEAGPDESYDRTRWVIIGALNAARKTVRIATPYFVPDTAIISALNAAALRGI
jgi:cardiolipin synthase A/B